MEYIYMYIYISLFVKIYMIHLLGTYVTIICNWLNKVSRSSVEVIKSVQENKLKVQIH